MRKCERSVSEVKRGDEKVTYKQIGKILSIASRDEQEKCTRSNLVAGLLHTTRLLCHPNTRSTQCLAMTNLKIGLLILNLTTPNN